MKRSLSSIATTHQVHETRPCHPALVGFSVPAGWAGYGERLINQTGPLVVNAQLPTPSERLHRGSGDLEQDQVPQHKETALRGALPDVAYVKTRWLLSKASARGLRLAAKRTLATTQGLNLAVLRC